MAGERHAMYESAFTLLQLITLMVNDEVYRP